MSKRVQALLEPYFALHEKWFIGERQVQKMGLEPLNVIKKIVRV